MRKGGSSGKRETRQGMAFPGTHSGNSGVRGKAELFSGRICGIIQAVYKMHGWNF